jgi:peroxiredoxin (alkyl hydroperoxide reductase subunit C)
VGVLARTAHQSQKENCLGLSTRDSHKKEIQMSIGAESRIPRILDQAPDFEARSTHGVIKLSDYLGKGKWIMLFSHPADFTPVCSTEFIAFAQHAKDFEKVNVQLIGTSVDSVTSHIAWARDLERVGNVRIKFPVVADLDQKVAQAYGMVHEAVTDTATVRAVFAIDPEGKIRAIVYYPMQVGRNVDELIRLFQALQTSDANGVSCPSDWRPGDAVLVPAPSTLSDAAKRSSDGTAGLDVKTWYLSTKELPKQ